MTNDLSLAPVIAHRGASADAMENTLNAFQLAQTQGASWVEFDVKLTADDVLVVFHDDDLKRLTGVRAAMSDVAFADLPPLNNGEAIPRFADVCELLTQTKLQANIEIKPNSDQAIATTDQLLAELAQHWPADKPLPLLSSFDFSALEQVHQRAPQYPLGLLLHEWREDWNVLADKFNASTVHLNVDITTPGRIQAINDSGRPVLCYTVNDSKHALQCWQQGVTSIFSDKPSECLKAWSQREAQ
jgi:glycerophosphoryl diester phosphodiesterase